MKKWTLFFLLLVLSCNNSHIKTQLGSEGKKIHYDNILISIPEDAVSESITIQIQKRTSAEKTFPEGSKLLNTTLSIKPDSLVFAKPIIISIPGKQKQERLAAKYQHSYLPIAESWVANETLQAKVHHGGEYCVIDMPDHYGILNVTKAKEALLVISDLHTGLYLQRFRQFMKDDGYKHPLWTFIYPPDNSIEENARFLASELEKLHGEFGPFRLDIVGFGIGGLIAARYGADTTLYHNDISSAIVTIGTPFWGTELADRNTAQKAKTPYRFYFIDGMGEQVKDLKKDSDLIKWLRKNRGQLCWHHYDDYKENKNFASLRGKILFEGDLPEEMEGDGVVSLSSTMLTFLEPQPFAVAHFDLMENRSVFRSASSFIKLFRTFNWPEVFTAVWQEELPFSRINEIWEQEVTLHFRDRRNLQLLLDMNENMLLSVPENGILITNGDNDTYPAWYLQGRGVRKDVLIANISLLNVNDNILYLKKNGLPIDLNEEQIRALRAKKRKDGSIFFVADSLISLLVKNTQRPVVFAATVAPQRMEPYPLRLRGMVFEIGEGNVDIETTESLFHSVFELTNTLTTPLDSINHVCRQMLINYHAALFKLIEGLIEEERFKEALDEIEFLKSFPAVEGVSGHIAVKESAIYYSQGNSTKGDDILQELLDKERNATIIKMVAETYSKFNRKERAIAVLADWLKEHPDDNEILKLLAEYGE